MKLALHLVDYTWPGGPAAIRSNLAEIGRAADEAGFSALAVADHVWQNPWIGGPEKEMLEAYSVLAFLAAHTARVSLLTLATAVTYRSPGILAKTVTTLDVLSGGRAALGIGAGHDEAEARGLGLPFPPTAARFEMMEETLQVCLRMWDGERGDERPFTGAHVQLARALNLPQTLTRPRPPILIAGTGEQKTLRLVARYADACGLYPMPDLPHKLDVLRRHCEAERRDYDTIEKTCTLPFAVGERGERTADLIKQLERLAGQGIQTVYLQPNPPGRVAAIEAIGRQVVPAVAA
jgi:F420-dependent oxidoreductase-like protein